MRTTRPRARFCSIDARRAARHASCLAAFVAIASCSGGDPVSTLPEGEASFIVSPVALTDLAQIIPLGNLNPPEHAFPTDHIYLNFPQTPGTAVTRHIYAPGDGVVTHTLAHGEGNQKLWVQATSSVTYYVDHVRLDPSVKIGVRVHAGQEIGTAFGQIGVDLGVTDSRTTLSGLLARGRYPEETLHARPPLSYFSEPMRSQLYERVKRVGPDRDGKIDFDAAGTLSGNWFAEELEVAQSGGPAAWGKQIAFVADNFDPSIPRISIGGRLAVQGVYAPGVGEPSFASVTPSSGIVRYSLRMQPSLLPLGTMLVQLTASDRIKVEVFLPGADASAFTSAAVTFVR